MHVWNTLKQVRKEKTKKIKIQQKQNNNNNKQTNQNADSLDKHTINNQFGGTTVCLGAASLELHHGFAPLKPKRRQRGYHCIRNLVYSFFAQAFL